VGGQLGPS